MIVFDLQCSHGHKFEAWFGSSGDYEGQKMRGLVSCPVCDDPAVEKAVMAPAVGSKSNQKEMRAPARQGAQAPRSVATMGAEDAAKLQAMMSQLAEVQAKVLENSAWVGGAFAEKARAMHYGDAPTESIHGIANVEEARALVEEGIAVAPLPIPVVPPEERN